MSPEIEAYEGNTSNPNFDGNKKKTDKTDQKEDSSQRAAVGNGSASGSEGGSAEKEEDSDNSGKRVTVSPRDYEKISAVAEEMGISMSGVYRLAFRHFLNNIDFDI